MQWYIAADTMLLFYNFPFAFTLDRLVHVWVLHDWLLHRLCGPTLEGLNCQTIRRRRRRWGSHSCTRSVSFPFPDLILSRTERRYLCGNLAQEKVLLYTCFTCPSQVFFPICEWKKNTHCKSRLSFYVAIPNRTITSRSFRHKKKN